MAGPGETDYFAGGVITCNGWDSLLASSKASPAYPLGGNFSESEILWDPSISSRLSRLQGYVMLAAACRLEMDSLFENRGGCLGAFTERNSVLKFY